MAHGSTRSLPRAGAKLVHAPCLGCEQSASPHDPHGRLPAWQWSFSGEEME